MRIRSFHIFLKNHFSNNEVVLNNTSLVIDGHNIQHKMWERSEKKSHFGCECNTFSNYITELLQDLQKAHVKCYFIFRGGKENISKLLKPQLAGYEQELRKNTFEPVLTREVLKETLNNLGLDYAICENTNKRECVALAQRLNCAVLAYDISFYFFGVKYIPFVTMHFDPSDNILRAKLYSIDELMNKFRLNNRQVAIFITLFDENVLSKEFQDQLLLELQLPLSYRSRHESFLSWLFKKATLALKIITKHVTDDENKVILSELERNEKFVKIQEPGGLVTNYMIDISSCAFTRCDKKWFTKGVLWKFIAVPYIDVYRYGILKGSWSIEDLEAEDSMLLSTPIVRYAFDLLTNFSNNDLKFIGRSIDNKLLNDGVIRIEPTISKPDYGPTNVFRNGWKDVSMYQLFEHFLRESVQVEVSALQKAPTECRLLIAALVYFARRKCSDVDNEVYAVLLSYVMLGVVDEETGRDCTLDDTHCEIARVVMDKYFYTTEEEANSILDRKLLHPLVEFQHCLRHFNFLNKLCGSSLDQTIYSKSFNATFVYKVLYDIKRIYNGDGNIFLEDTLKHAITVLSFVKKLFNVYSEIKLETI